MRTCEECLRLREETAALFAEYIVRKDELAMTEKKDTAYSGRRKALRHVEGQLDEARKCEHRHKEEAHASNENLDGVSIREKLDRLRERLQADDEAGVQEAVFDLTAPRTGFWRRVPDEIVDGVLSLLREPEASTSHVAGFVLNYFEFESQRLTPQQQKLCRDFLAAYGDRFTDVHAAQVVTELRYDVYGDWLR